jgi:hypothetical protein
MSEKSRSTGIANETQTKLRKRGSALEAALNGLIVAAINTPEAVMAASQAAGASAAAAAKVMIDIVQKADTAAQVAAGAVREAHRNEVVTVVLTYVRKHSEVLLPFLSTKSIKGLVIRNRSYCIQMTRDWVPIHSKDLSTKMATAMEKAGRLGLTERLGSAVGPMVAAAAAGTLGMAERVGSNRRPFQNWRGNSIGACVSNAKSLAENSLLNA